MRYEEVNGFVDFIGQTVAVGEAVIVASPWPCTKGDTPLHYGTVKRIRFVNDGRREHWKIDVEVALKGNGDPHLVEILTPKRLIGA